MKRYIFWLFIQFIHVFSPFRLLSVDRYVFHIFIKLLVNAFLLFISIQIFGNFAVDFPEHLSELEHGNEKLSLPSVLMVYFYQLPDIFVFVSPMAFLFATIYTLDQIYKNYPGDNLSSCWNAYFSLFWIWICRFINCLILIPIKNTYVTEGLKK